MTIPKSAFNNEALIKGRIKMNLTEDNACDILKSYSFGGNSC